MANLRVVDSVSEDHHGKPYELAQMFKAGRQTPLEMRKCSRRFWVADFDGHELGVRIGDYPDELMWTLFVNRLEVCATNSSSELGNLQLSEDESGITAAQELPEVAALLAQPLHFRYFGTHTLLADPAELNIRLELGGYFDHPAHLYVNDRYLASFEDPHETGWHVDWSTEPKVDEKLLRLLRRERISWQQRSPSRFEARAQGRVLRIEFLEFHWRHHCRLDIDGQNFGEVMDWPITWSLD